MADLDFEQMAVYLDVYKRQPDGESGVERDIGELGGAVGHGADEHLSLIHIWMDMIYFGMVLQKIEGVYGFTSEFACPVDVTVYVDPAAGITEKMFGEAIDAKELIIPAKEEIGRAHV